MKKILFSISISLLLASCLKEEIPVSIPDPGELNTAQVGMDGDYKYQVYFNLELGENVSQNFKTEWDLGFECSPEGWHIILNSSKLMKAAWVDGTFWERTDTAGITNWIYDGVTGHLDSTAIGDWSEGPSYCIIDRGVDERGRHQGFSKLSVISFDENEFNIQFSDLEENKANPMSVLKNADLNFISFSFDEGGKQIAIEPDKNNWDLVFTQYTETLFDGTEYIPYLVTGTQINRNQMMVAVEEERSFEEIELEDVLDYEFEDRIDRPGYDWKYFDFDNSVYTVLSNKIYIIRSYNGKYYKLRFTDFYNDSGEKGYPKFEYQAL